MNKKRLIGLGQNCLIFALSVSALFLLTRTTLFSSFVPTSLAQRVNPAFSSAAFTGADSTALSTLSIPLRIMQRSEFACHGEDSLTTSGAAFESVGSFLGEAIGSSYGMETVREEEFLRALEQSGLYFNFPGALPLELLSARLGVALNTTQSLDICRCLLSVGSAEHALLYLYTQSGVCLRCSTAVSSASLKSYLDTVGGNGSAFAFELGGDYEELSPFTLILGEPNNRIELSSANALGDFTTEELLRRAEFNAHTKDRYTESNGTLVVLEAQRMLRLAPNGTMNYTGDQAEEPGSLYRIDAAEGELPSRLEAATAAQQLLSSILSEKLGDALIYLHSMESVAGGYRLYFDYIVGGTPVLFSDGSHAAEVLTQGDTISAFTLRLRRYTLTENECLLLPLAQAAAIGGLYEQSELNVAYIDTFADVTHAEWIAG